MARKTDFLVKTRKGAGAYLQELRTKREMSLGDAAMALGYGWATDIHRVEQGIVPLGADRWEIAAKAYRVVPDEFAAMMLRWYNPYAYKMIFGRAPFALPYPEQVVELMNKRAA